MHDKILIIIIIIIIIPTNQRYGSNNKTTIYVIKRHALDVITIFITCFCSFIVGQGGELM